MKPRSIFSAWTVALVAVAFPMASIAWGQRRGGTLVMVVAG